ncbi:MAG TPA: WYL domain-containing protein [Rhizomicrobium sp.]|jgi:predicted DNA-binding transcriptional regulator YafY|nr:WYL domain-containing protein [Rhizomicrobium sp.]
MLASRLLSILMLLQVRGRMSARELAAEFEVSVRTIHRDIDQLSAAGIPVYADRGRSGGFALLDGYRTKLTGLTQPEAEALFLAGLPGPAAQLGLADMLSAARLKLLAALPAHVQPAAERIASRFHLDPAPWFRAGDPQTCLQTVAHAVWNAAALKFNYRTAGRHEARLVRVRPLGLVLKAGTWYLVGQTGKAIRTYRVANIENAEVTDESFERPKNFDLATHWAKACHDYEEGLWRAHADVRLSPKGVALLALLGSHVEQAARETAKPDADGWVRCTIPIETDAHGVRELMRLCEDMELIGPPALRDTLAATLAAMSSRYAPQSSDVKRGRR